jgi:hypothetical protein
MSTYVGANESVQAFVERMKQQFAAEHEAREIEIEGSKVIITIGRSRVFNGFLAGGRPVIGFDYQLAAEMTTKEASKVQETLQTMGFESVQVPSLARKASAF